MTPGNKAITKIVLQSDTFSIIGYRKNDLDWFEFDTCIAGQEYKSIGGDDRNIFLDRLYEILTKNGGKRLAEIKDFLYTALVGGKEAEYLGCLVFSGYKSLYFFMLDGEIKHVLFLDRDTNLIAHTELMSDFKNSWRRKIPEFR
jgi:hypothetical protein